MRLINPEYAIYCYTGFGPRFGGGADIHIADECDKNANSYLDYPTSYSCSDLSSKSQENIEQLIGVKNGNSFKVLEYEVFQTIWWLIISLVIVHK